MLLEQFRRGLKQERRFHIGIAWTDLDSSKDSQIVESMGRRGKYFLPER